MECLIKLYDSEHVSNLISVLAFHPKKAIFLYDKKYTKISELQNINDACTKDVPNMNFEFICIDTQSLDNIIKTCKRVIHANPKCFFDITGGEELSVIGAYLASRQCFVPIFKIDIDLGNFINIYGCSHLSGTFKMPDINLDILLACRGAVLKNCFHMTPGEDQFNSILMFCNVVLNDTRSWKELCNYIQNGLKNIIEHNCVQPNYFITSPASDITLTRQSLSLLQYAQEIGLIYNLRIDNNVNFVFRSENIKKYMSDFGSWLELYSYIVLKQSGLFKDLNMSVRIGWNKNMQKYLEITNELDVVFFSGITPVFVSCKLSEPNTEALQELSMYPRYFGGKRSKCILITAGNVKSEKPRVLNRAKEMNIGIIDKSDLSPQKMVKRIQDILASF